jgi:hypothetical protein
MRLLRQTATVTGVLSMVGIIVFSLAGNPAPAWLSLLVVLERVIKGGGLAAVYVLSAGGYGRLLTPLWRGSSHGRVFQFAAGLGLLLWLSHLAGWQGPANQGAVCALHAGVVVVGLVLLVHEAWPCARRVGVLRTQGVHRLWMIGSMPLGVLVVAACNPPGWLWGSEFGGYDVLSYHLALPQEWLAEGRIRPLEHNVYSFLPGYVESAFHALAAATFAPGRGVDAWGLLAGDGFRVHACQFLHAWMTLLAAWWTASAAGAACARAGVANERLPLARAAGGLLVLATPWSVVTGSLAYNDMGVVAMLAAGVLGVLDDSLTPGRRGVLLGVLVGTACSIKPTAVLFVAVPLGLALALTVPVRVWARLAVGGAGATIAMCGPWLVRNALASGDPVFPFGAVLFAGADGSLGHWSAEQVARYGTAHRFDGSILDRLRLLVLPEQAREGVPDIARYRGLTHPQWAFFWVLVAGGAPMGAWLARGRRSAAGRAGPVAWLSAMLVLQVALWLTFTHVQSRFILPAIVPGAMLIAHCVALIAGTRVATGVAAIAVVVQSAATIAIHADQHGGRPNALLVPGIDARTGQSARDLWEQLNGEEREQWLAGAGPEAHANVMHPGAEVCLLGGATPLYFNARVRYATTWDTPALMRIVGDAPPAEWNSRLRDSGVDLVLVDLGELSRLERSGWLDPRLSPGPILQWLHGHAVKVRAWPEAGIFLVSTRAKPEP